jgi:hypothetical protein
MHCVNLTVSIGSAGMRSLSTSAPCAVLPAWQLLRLHTSNMLCFISQMCASACIHQSQQPCSLSYVLPSLPAFSPPCLAAGYGYRRPYRKNYRFYIHKRHYYYDTDYCGRGHFKCFDWDDNEVRTPVRHQHLAPTWCKRLEFAPGHVCTVLHCICTQHSTRQVIPLAQRRHMVSVSCVDVRG